MREKEKKTARDPCETHSKTESKAARHPTTELFRTHQGNRYLTLVRVCPRAVGVIGSGGNECRSMAQRIDRPNGTQPIVKGSAARSRPAFDSSTSHFDLLLLSLSLRNGLIPFLMQKLISGIRHLSNVGREGNFHD
ncbi:hypothetical protein CEXT_179001 [Caerostris extrusa]|uniref:K Homology domain-containing protein n=1 Tax=Caerostris extrusa TaxID=172846 RepID=A0AAV4RVT4_CAEEX|nr:hypothetical protein CEXT_179001 [Caerostris extrusa]